MQMVPMTKAGSDKLREELDHLHKVERPRIVTAIAEARAHGDLKENAEYHAAKEQQGLTEARIRDIEHKLAHAQIIDVTRIPNEGKVIFGATITVFNCNEEKEVKYQIVGEDEADFKNGKLSVSSPVARALVGKHEGDVAEVSTPTGAVEYEVIKVEYV